MSIDTNLTLSQIKILVSKDLKINIKKNTRNRKYVYGRAIYFKLCKEFTHASLNEIGDSVNREHATVIHGLTVFDTMAMYNDSIMQTYNRVRDVLLQEGNQALKRYSEVHYWRIKYEDLLGEYDKLLRDHLELEKKFNNQELEV